MYGSIGVLWFLDLLLIGDKKRRAVISMLFDNDHGDHFHTFSELIYIFLKFLVISLPIYKLPCPKDMILYVSTNFEA